MQMVSIYSESEDNFNSHSDLIDEEFREKPFNKPKNYASDGERK